MQDVFIIDALRTPIGRYKGALSSVRPDDLAAHVIRALAARHPDLVTLVNHVVFGATNQAGEDNRNVARMASLLAGISFEVPAVTVNRLCGSGLEAVCDAARRIATGEAEVVIAGGVESMSRAPFVFGKTEEAFSRQPPKVFDTTIGWRFENSKMVDRFPLLSMGETAEEVATKWSISREDQDAFAVESHRRAVLAIENRAFEREIVPVEIVSKKGEKSIVTSDESPRADSTAAALSALRPVFRKNGSVTAGNSSPINDGAASLLLVSGEIVKEMNLSPLARVVSHATAGVHPSTMGEGPIPAAQKALVRAGWRSNELDAIELNEAFAAQVLACMRGLELDASKVNVNGGAIALGHPIGASGARILGTLVHSMVANDRQRGLASLCIGVGQGIALLVER